jgi:hypothetical protein
MLAILAHKKRHKFPRSVLFFYCFLPFALGLGLLISTYLDFSHDKVMPLFFKGKVIVSKLNSPKLFLVGVVSNILFYLCFVTAGLIGMLIAITNTNFRFKK